jgi:hypothetical protein
MIIYSKEKKKGFRGFKYIAKGYIDEQGGEINEKTKEGTEMIEIVCEVLSNEEENDIIPLLRKEVEKKISEYKPIWNNK